MNGAANGVARICCEEGQRCKVCHAALTVDFRAGCSSCSMTNSFVTNAVLSERAVSCWHLHQLISQTVQYLDSWLSDLLQSELKWNCWKSRGARAPVPHSWRRHWARRGARAGADHPSTPRPWGGGLMEVKGSHHGVKGKGATKMKLLNCR